MQSLSVSVLHYQAPSCQCCTFTEVLEIYFSTNDDEKEKGEDVNQENEDEEKDTDTEDSSRQKTVRQRAAALKMKQRRRTRTQVEPESACNSPTGDAPSLKTLRLIGVALHHCIPPSSNLTILHVHSVSMLYRRFRVTSTVYPP